MRNLKFYNNLLGWIVFLIATLTYFLTLEPTTSLWDCGEFIASAYKLEVGHPPGAPLFMITARIASLLSFGDVTVAAKMINGLSALTSSFTILFLFWTITHFAKKIVIQSAYVKEKIPTVKILGIQVYRTILEKPAKEITFTTSQIIAILGSGVVGALAYTFSDTFWFSAVEAEVYAFSSLFTAVVFWAILKWENIADEKYANRWLILIAYLMGLSIGVHLLNLLAIPAIVMVYYFKKYEVNTKGLIAALGIALALLGGIMYGVIPGLVKIASVFEILFVNTFGMPFNSGVVFYFFLLLGLIVGGIYYTNKHKKVIANTIILGVMVMIIGYSSYAMIVIRSAANPPMDENNPENVFALLSYLNREQYGDRPLIYGHYYNAEITGQEKNYTYTPKGEKYIKIAKTNPEYIYDSKNKGLFPRMYSNNGGHVSAYKSWATINVPEGEKPTMIDNLEFFFKYQLGHMYFRYFMWNFAGRQNDTQGHGGYQKGNWISGISFIDALRLGPQNKLPDVVKNHHGRNTYYFLPLLLGLIGLFFSYSVHKRSFLIIGLLFLLTGVAIVVYLNQTPYQPRERDYAYAGSFYAFSIWIGLSVLGIYDAARKKMSAKIAAISATALAIIIPIQMAAENWDDHDRSGRYTARDFAINYLQSCAPNAILFTFGDNDTFPLWYVQEVEEIRTDVRVVNLSLLGTDWYINQMRRKAYEAEGVPFILEQDKYIQSKRNIVPLYDYNEVFLEEKYKSNQSKLKPAFKQLFAQFMNGIDDSKFPELHKNDYNQLVNNSEKITPIQLLSLINALASEQGKAKYFESFEWIDSIKKQADDLLRNIATSPAPVKSVIEFVGSDDPSTKIRPGTDEEMDFIPGKRFVLPVNKKYCLKNGDITTDMDSIPSEITWTVSKNYFLKNDIAVFDILAANNWERPIYFAVSMGLEEYLGLHEYFRLEGFAYRLVPYKVQTDNELVGEINSDILYDNIMNKFKWGRMNEPDVLIANYDLRQINIMDFRTLFARLALKLINENKNTKAKNILDLCVDLMPHKKVNYDQSMLPVLDAYYKLNDLEKATEISLTMGKFYDQYLSYYNSLSGPYASDIARERNVANAILGQITQMAEENNNKDAKQKLFEIYGKYVNLD